MTEPILVVRERAADGVCALAPLTFAACRSPRVLPYSAQPCRREDALTRCRPPRTLLRLASALLLASLISAVRADDLPAPSAGDALEALYRGDAAAAVAICDALLQREPGNAVVRRNVARVLRESGRFEEALAHYDALLAGDAAREVRIAAAETALLGAQPLRALGYLELVDRAADRLYLSALALADVGRKSEALAAVAESLELDAFQPMAWFRQAELQYGLGELDRAQESFLKALAQEPNLTAALLPLARIHLSRGEHEKAHRLLARAAASLPANAAVRELLAALEEQRPALVEGAREARRQRRETAAPRRAAALPADRAAIPSVRIGLLEKAQVVSLKIGGPFEVSSSGAAGAAVGSAAAVLKAGTAAVGSAGAVLSAGAVDGEVAITDEAGALLLRSAGPVRLAYADPLDTTVLFDVEYGRGSFWAGTEDRMYRGVIELAVRAEGLTVVNELPVEEYLYSVLPSEMPSSWPAAALRAQAVAARSYTMANLGRFASRGFDLLGNVFSAAYRGMLAETPAVRAAVDDTRGLVLMDGEKPLAAYYSANCGGHTETTAVVWGFESGLPAAADPRLDAGAFPLPPDDLARWLAERPVTYCSHPRYSSRSAYRWQLWVGREEIEARIGRDLGSVTGIEPLGRGRSGRIPAVRVRGTAGELIVRGDSIRWSLGGLRSNLFTVEPSLGAGGLPEYFVFTGGGWGHGVGMCQSGAAGMAAEGRTTEQILAHYYGSAEMRRLW